jgi:hypothetical protein
MIAKHVWNEQEQHAVLFTERRYSNTTTKHIAIVDNASSHLTKLYVPDPALEKGELFERWYSMIKGVAGCINQAKRPAKYLLDIAQTFNKAKTYADFFGYEMPELLVKAGEVQNLEQYRDLLKDENRLRKAQAKKEQAERLKIQKRKLKLWREFKADEVDRADGYDYLRFNSDTQNIETTQRIRFSLSAGYQLYQTILDNTAKTGQSFLDRYSIAEINPAFIRIGCHKVTLKEIKSFAKQQGWQ